MHVVDLLLFCISVVVIVCAKQCCLHKRIRLEHKCSFCGLPLKIIYYTENEDYVDYCMSCPTCDDDSVKWWPWSPIFIILY